MVVQGGRLNMRDAICSPMQECVQGLVTKGAPHVWVSFASCVVADLRMLLLCLIWVLCISAGSLRAG